MTTVTIQSIAAGQTEAYVFVDEEYLSAGGKQQILTDWQRFMSSGFKKLFFTRDLYRFLHYECAFVAHTNQETFWATYFNSDVKRLRLFLNQFGGNGHAAETGSRAWLDGPAIDLKRALCQETARLYQPMLQVLEDLELKHTELGRIWREFALRQVQDATQAAPLQQSPRPTEDATPNASQPDKGVDPGYPPHYLVSENARNLLAYAAYIALHSPPPLPGLQRQFPLPEAGLYVAQTA